MTITKAWYFATMTVWYYFNEKILLLNHFLFPFLSEQLVLFAIGNLQKCQRIIYFDSSTKCYIFFHEVHASSWNKYPLNQSDSHVSVLSVKLWTKIHMIIRTFIPRFISAGVFYPSQRILWSNFYIPLANCLWKKVACLFQSKKNKINLNRHKRLRFICTLS